MQKRNFRLFEIALGLISLFVLAASYYFQYFQNLAPCPLCLMQRICVFVLLSLCLMAICIVSLKRAKLVTLLQILISFLGIYFAGRQVWIQSLPPDQLPVCVPGLDILIKYFPFKDVAKALFWGSGECAEMHWSWLGLSMPEWSLLYFLGMFIASSLLFYRTSQYKTSKRE